MKKRTFALATLAFALGAQFSLPAYAQDDTIRIGLILDQSGPFAEYGRQMEGGIKVFMKQQGDMVAGKKIELIIRDSTGPNPEVGKRLAQEMIVRHKVHFLAGFGFSNVALAVAPLATQSKTPMVVMNAAASSITNASPYIVRTSFTLAQTSDSMGKWAAANGIKKVMTVVADYAPGHDSEAAFRKAYLAGGGKIVGDLRVPISNREFSPYLQRVKDAKPDAVFVFLPSGEPMISFVKGYAERGMKQSGIRIIAASGWADDGDLPAIGDGALDVISTHNYSTAHDSPLNKKFVKEFYEIDKSGLVPHFMAAGAYDGMAAIYAAVTKLNGNVTGEKAIAALKGWSSESPRGPISIDPATRDIVQNIYVRRVQKVNGKLVNVEFDSFKAVKDPGKL
jgi:branched-chain amino acid transport system substrate-binding protein